MRPVRLPSLGCAALAFTLGVWLGRSDLGRQATRAAHRAAVQAVASHADLDLRQGVLLEHPEIVRAMQRGGAFGGDFSPPIARNMFSRDPEPIAEARAMTRVEEVAPRTWLVRMPIVNAVLFETQRVIDTCVARILDPASDALAYLDVVPAARARQLEARP